MRLCACGCGRETPRNSNRFGFEKWFSAACRISNKGTSGEGQTGRSDRNLKIIAMRKAGVGYVNIAKAVGVSEKTAFNVAGRAIQVEWEREQVS